MLYVGVLLELLIKRLMDDLLWYAHGTGYWVIVSDLDREKKCL